MKSRSGQPGRPSATLTATAQAQRLDEKQKIEFAFRYACRHAERHDEALAGDRRVADNLELLRERIEALEARALQERLAVAQLDALASKLASLLGAVEKQVVASDTFSVQAVGHLRELIGQQRGLPASVAHAVAAIAPAASATPEVGELLRLLRRLTQQLDDLQLGEQLEQQALGSSSAPIVLWRQLAEAAA